LIIVNISRADHNHKQHTFINIILYMFFISFRKQEKNKENAT